MQLDNYQKSMKYYNFYLETYAPIIIGERNHTITIVPIHCKNNIMNDIVYIIRFLNTYL